MNLNPEQVYTLASIVETNKDENKGKIAGVYLSRFHNNENCRPTPLLNTPCGILPSSGYGKTHRRCIAVQYLPEPGATTGPICTPSAKTIDAV